MRRASVVQLALLLGACSATETNATGTPAPPAPFWAIQTELAFDPVHVFDREGERWDGRAAKVSSQGATFEIRASDSVGRDVSVSLDALALSARFSRCLGDVCDRSRAEARPLWSGRERVRGLALLGELDDEAWSGDRVLSVTARPGLVALALGLGGLALVDVSEPANPRLLHEERPSERGEAVTDVEWLDERWLLVASSTRGLRVLDVRDPLRPLTAVDAFPGGAREVHTLFVDGQVCHAARTGPAGGLDVVDLSEPQTPRLVVELTLPGCREVHEVHVTERTLLASCLDDGLFAFDLAVPTSPTRIAHWAERQSHSAWLLDDGVSVAATSERFGGPLQLLELDRDAGALTPLGTFSPGSAASAHEVSCRRQRCTLSYYQEGVLELDVSDRTEPKLRRRFPTWDRTAASFLEGASATSRHGRLLYVADTTRGLLVLARE